MRDTRLRVGAQDVFSLLNAVFAPAGDAVHSAFFRHMQKRFRHFQRTQDAAGQFRAVLALRRAFNHVPDDHGVDVGIRTPANFPRLHRPELLFRGFGRFCVSMRSGVVRPISNPSTFSTGMSDR